MVNVADVVVAFPQLSVAVKITDADPVCPQPSLNAWKLLVQVTDEQASVAEAPPLEANHACKAAVFPAPSHSTEALTACVVIDGAVVSVIVKVAEVVAAFPQLSVAVKITVAVPVCPQPSLKA